MSYDVTFVQGGGWVLLLHLRFLSFLCRVRILLHAIRLHLTGYRASRHDLHVDSVPKRVGSFHLSLPGSSSNGREFRSWASWSEQSDGLGGRKWLMGTCSFSRRSRAAVWEGADHCVGGYVLTVSPASIAPGRAPPAKAMCKYVTGARISVASEPIRDKAPTEDTTISRSKCERTMDLPQMIRIEGPHVYNTGKDHPSHITNENSPVLPPPSPQPTSSSISTHAEGHGILPWKMIRLGRTLASRRDTRVPR